MIFPVNERVVVLGRELDGLGVGREDFGDERDGEVRRCLRGWGRWHVGRIVAPVCAGLAMGWAG